MKNGQAETWAEVLELIDAQAELLPEAKTYHVNLGKNEAAIRRQGYDPAVPDSCFKYIVRPLHSVFIVTLTDSASEVRVFSLS